MNIGHVENLTPDARTFGLNQFMRNHERTHGTSFSPETIARLNARTAKAVNMYRAEREHRAQLKGGRN